MGPLTAPKGGEIRDDGKPPSGEGVVAGETDFAAVFVGDHPPCRARQQLQGALQALRAVRYWLSGNGSP